MKETKVNTLKVLTVPAGVNTVRITHEWGDVVVAGAAVVAASTYNWTPDSVGVHSIIWKNGSTTISTEYYNVYMPLVGSVDFFADYPEHETLDEKFPTYERRVRGVIETFTHQRFGPIIGKTLKIPGDGGDNLELPYHITSLTSVTDNWGEDLTSYVEIAPGEGYFLQYIDRYRAPFVHDYKRDLSTERLKQDFFSERLDFIIAGNFGWDWVPNDVMEAGKILIADEFSESNDLRRHGINEAQLGDFSYKLNADQWGTTGNTQADLLLSNYVIMRIGLV